MAGSGCFASSVFSLEPCYPVVEISTGVTTQRQIYYNCKYFISFILC